MPKVLIPMADYGNDPTEVATPFSIFKEAGFTVDIATENGATPRCDAMMLEGWTGKLLGAAKPAQVHHASLAASPEIQKPLSWSSPTFSLDPYDLVFLPGGHEKGMAQLITSPSLHSHLASYTPLTARSGPAKAKKTLAAICHGMQILSNTKLPASSPDAGKSVLHDKTTTALPGTMEMGAWYATRLFLGDYYRTFGGEAETVEVAVRSVLDRPEVQWRGSLGGGGFVVEDEKFRYLSGRFPPDADGLARRAVEVVREAVGA
ncbi:MAG: hypothetical protein M1828_006701 [Chrysothrix sp. TS-e1954]|nr:MAG: hypothetical protein M1828_006701 [Chrysothrix sp. TS-e1954]